MILNNEMDSQIENKPTETKPLKVFLSHQMNGLMECEVKEIRRMAKEYLTEKYGDIELLDNYNHSDAPSNANRLWHLGKSIQQMSEADAVYFCPEFSQANGCVVEKIICSLYKIKVLE